MGDRVSSLSDSDQAEDLGILEHLFLVRLILSAEVRSSHPLAVGISEFCKNRLSEMIDKFASLNESLESLTSPLNGDLSVIPGQGIKLMTAIADRAFKHTSFVGSSNEFPHQTVVLVGSPLLMSENSIKLSQQALRIANGFRAGGKVALYVAINGVLRGILGVSDTVREEAASVVEGLRRRGVACYMITGDEQSTAHAIGSVVGIPPERIFAGSKPHDKEKLVSTLQSRGKKVAFIGDGTNDSPALARAHVGIAMSGGTSIAIDTGDMILFNDNLQAVIVALDLSAKTIRRIKINYFWALLYNVCLIPLAAGIFYPAYQFSLAPTFAGMAMAASSVSVILSSLTLNLYNPPVALESGGSTSTHHGDDEGNGSGGNEDDDNARLISTTERCNCPVSSAPIFHSPPESLFERLSNRIFGQSRHEYESVAMDGAEDDDSLQIELRQVVAPLHRNESLATAADESAVKKGSCSCQRGNCRCGSACECGLIEVV